MANPMAKFFFRLNVQFTRYRGVNANYFNFKNYFFLSWSISWFPNVICLIQIKFLNGKWSFRDQERIKFKFREFKFRAFCLKQRSLHRFNFKTFFSVTHVLLVFVLLVICVMMFCSTHVFSQDLNLFAIFTTFSTFTTFFHQNGQFSDWSTRKVPI